ncbi:sulfur oxidation c-type cytochrome SoxA [Thiohalorhabdus methylotrophus]|uniref:SoxAX cytochrome complex subunit A n=1 Tax=Thiohalorhabdus methylotrophus TaxID=3242694 RepID=A0ABV4TRB2_9GAMM
MKERLSVAAATLALLLGTSQAGAQLTGEEQQRAVSEEGAEAIGEQFNPGELDIDEGKALFQQEGPNGKSCASCHGEDGEDLKGAATQYPKVVDSVYPIGNTSGPELVHKGQKQGEALNPNKAIEDEGVRTLAMQINICRANNMDAEPWNWSQKHGKKMRYMTIFVKSLSTGMPLDIATDGKAKEYWEKGKKFYWMKRGQLNFACGTCHVLNGGMRIRGQILSDVRGQYNKFPTFRMKQQQTRLMHTRYRGCNRRVRAHDLPFQDPAYRALELYHGSLSNGEPMRVPGHSL